MKISHWCYGNTPVEFCSMCLAKLTTCSPSHALSHSRLSTICLWDHQSHVTVLQVLLKTRYLHLLFCYKHCHLVNGKGAHLTRFIPDNVISLIYLQSFRYSKVLLERGLTRAVHCLMAQLDMGGHSYLTRNVREFREHEFLCMWSKIIANLKCYF